MHTHKIRDDVDRRKADTFPFAVNLSANNLTRFYRRKIQELRGGSRSPARILSDKFLRSFLKGWGDESALTLSVVMTTACAALIGWRPVGPAPLPLPNSLAPERPHNLLVIDRALLHLPTSPSLFLLHSQSLPQHNLQLGNRKPRKHVPGPFAKLTFRN